MRKILLLPGCAVVGLSMVLPAYAQGSARQANEEALVPVGPMEVTGRAVTEPSSAVSRTRMPKDVSADASGLSDAFAGWHVAASGAHSFNDTHALRGLANTPIFGGPAVSMYLDEIPVFGPAGLPEAQQVFDAASLYRGPAASGNFGYAGPAGVLVLHSSTGPKSPVSARAYAGDHGLRAGMLDMAWTGGAGNSVVGRFSAMEREGYLLNQSTGKEIDHRENQTALLRMETQPFPRLALAMTVHGTRSSDGEQPLSPLDGPLRVVSRSREGFTEHEALNAGLSGRFETESGQLFATLAFNRWDLGPYRSVLTFGPMELVNDAEIQRRNRSIELRYASNEASAAGWSLTALAARTETDGGFTRAMGDFILEQSHYRIADRPLALSAGGWWRIAPRWRISAGLRAERNDQTYERQETVPSHATLMLAGEDTALLPRVEVNHKIDARTRWTLSASAGRKPGGFSAFTGNRELAAFGPERNRALETSLAHERPAKRLRMTLRAYAYDISGYQIERSFATGAVTDDYLVVNAPSARSIGGECEMSWQATRELALQAELGGGRVTLRDFTDPYSKINYSGRRAPYAPAHEARLSATCRSARGFDAMLALLSTGRVYFSEGEEARYSQGAFTRLDAGLGWRNRGWRAALTVRNVTGRDYYSAISPGTGHGTPGAPRTVMVTLEWSGSVR